MADPSSVSMVIPAVNEAPSIGEVIAGLKRSGPWHELLVIDDGSTDDTAARAAAAGAVVVRHPYNKLFSPLRVFAPASAATFLLGVVYGLVNLFATGKIPNGAVLLILFAVMFFLVGLVSKQIAALRFGAPRRPNE